jgi:hypothetical protein
LEKRKRETVDEIRRRLGPDDMVYSAIRAGKKRESMASNLLGGIQRRQLPSQDW